MKHIVVTGANGFVGRALSGALLEAGHAVTGLIRSDAQCIDGVRRWVHARPDFDGLEQAWPTDVDADCVVHLAARVHVMRDTAADPLAIYRATNVEGSLRVARAAKARGAKRFVFVSSIKAVAERDGGVPLRESDPPRPEDAYGRSKQEAETALREFGARTGLEIVIVRPPLVYGPGVRANFLQLIRAIAGGIPLPLGAVAAQRSLVYVGNLVDALVACAIDPRAANECFHVADGRDLSVSELAEAIGRHLHRRARLVPVPVAWLRAAGRLLGRADQVSRLVDGLRVDTAHLRATLGWNPPYTVDEGLAATANWYRATY
ncbi:NAD-dependent dehydratase [Trinickia dabaoshanensis]|uniref:NAD-dependent dehydratase n=1 Tax=Trinickia dabaoshanensis TaxID=564714 RepID=A0A2N7VFD4_9BURK|nr:SDR family oxidoreductase [Trinickia dabaoshanensis]PMS15855.1 NAD-dependent dehydratase [Trinickia dabaoshanensis]